MRYVVISDARKDLPRMIAAMAVATALPVAIGAVTGGAGGTVLFVLGGLLGTALLAVSCFAAVAVRRGRQPRVLVTERGILYTGRGREDLLPAELIRSIGVSRESGQVLVLAAHFDHTAPHPFAQKLARSRTARKGLLGPREPGRLLLAMIGDSGPGTIDFDRLREIRAMVEETRMTAWRDERTTWSRPPSTLPADDPLGAGRLLLSGGRLTDWDHNVLAHVQEPRWNEGDRGVVVHAADGRLVLRCAYQRHQDIREIWVRGEHDAPTGSVVRSGGGLTTVRLDLRAPNGTTVAIVETDNAHTRFAARTVQGQDFGEATLHESTWSVSFDPAVGADLVRMFLAAVIAGERVQGMAPAGN
ncbi:hypothetical protein ACQEU3_15570 [Spirillospora sp. CA-253888]